LIITAGIRAKEETNIAYTGPFGCCQAITTSKLLNQQWTFKQSAPAIHEFLIGSIM